VRALCGAIITAGALIGLGLTAIGYGIRYQGTGIQLNDKTGYPYGAPSLMVDQVVLWCAGLIGLGIAFVGLALHHFRRYHEHLRSLPGQATHSPGPPGSPHNITV
jgi:hypothetical protein